MNNLNNYLNNSLRFVNSNVYASTIIGLFLVLYGGLAKPKLPSFIRNLFNNPIFRVLILALIMYRGNKNPQLSIMLAVAFVITLNLVSEQETIEKITNWNLSQNENTEPKKVDHTSNFCTSSAFGSWVCKL